MLRKLLPVYLDSLYASSSKRVRGCVQKIRRRKFRIFFCEALVTEFARRQMRAKSPTLPGVKNRTYLTKTKRFSKNGYLKSEQFNSTCFVYGNTVLFMVTLFCLL